MDTKDTAEEAAETVAEVVAPGSVEEADEDRDGTVSKSEFESFRDAITARVDELAASLPVAPPPVDINPVADTTPVKPPWTHRRFGG